MTFMTSLVQALRLIIVFLADKLPSHVRFVFTSRPDAAVGGIREILERTFGHGVGAGGGGADHKAASGGHSGNHTGGVGIKFIGPHEVRKDLPMPGGTSKSSPSEMPGISTPPAALSAVAIKVASISPGVASSVKLFFTVCNECGLEDELQKVIQRVVRSL